MIGKSLLKFLAQRSIRVQRAYRWHRGRLQVGGYPDWAPVLAGNAELWRKARESSATGPRVLLATSMGGLPTAVIMDSLLAIALTLRGANVHLLLCDSFLPACLMAEIGLMSPRAFGRKGPQGYFCKHCYSIGSTMYRALGLELHRYSELITLEEARMAEEQSLEVPLEHIENFVMDGVPLGEHAMAGALRYFARSDLAGHPEAEAILRRYFKAALLANFAAKRLLRGHSFEVVSCINGIYVPQGIIAAVARNEERRVVAWSVAYRKRSFIFSHTDTYHHTLMSEPVPDWENMTWSGEHEKEIMDYLKSRRRGGRDWIAFLDKNPNENLTRISKALRGVDFSRPCIGMLTNVAWDAQLHYPANAFPNMLDWVIRTIQYFAKRQDLQLIIRVHPAEVSGDIPSRQPVVGEIRKAFPTLPKNVFVIPPQSRISTYALAEACNAVIIYGTKTGVELTSLGIPVIVAGEAWIRNKGITIDATSAEHYFQILDQLPLKERMADDSAQRARKYAYHFFFRRMIPVSQVEPTGGEPRFRVGITSLEDLLPGRSEGLDRICDGILKGSPFIYPAERLGDIHEQHV